MSARRITIVASEVLGVPGTGGPGTADSFLAVALGRHGHRVELLVAPGREVGRLSPEWRRSYDEAAVRVRPLEQRSRVRPQFLGPTYEVLHALRTDPPDIVVADDWRGLAYAALRARQLGAGFGDTAFVVYCHGPARVLAEAARKVPDTVARFGEEVAERACMELADAVVSPSAWLLGWLREHGWPVPESARVVQNLWQSVVLEQPLGRAPSGARVRRLAFFGQLREGKGIHLLVGALKELDADLLAGVELLFLGRETPRWTAERVRDELRDVVARVTSMRFERELERSEALAELERPGTLALMPSLVENSPYAVAECLERGVPFVAARTGGVPELVAEDDHARVLVSPTVEDLSRALREALSSETGFAPARVASPPEESLGAWLELVEQVAPARCSAPPAPQRVSLVVQAEESERRAQLLVRTSRVEVEVVSAPSRRAGLERATADWVVFLDEEDELDETALDALVAAQVASGADAVTLAVRPEPGVVRLFLGDPGALGLVENHYGVLGLVRRSAVPTEGKLDAAGDPDWPLLARIALSGALVVSLPETLARHRGRPGTVADVPGAGLAVLEAFEERSANGSRGLPQLAATLAAAYARRAAAASGPPRAGSAQRALALLRAEGVTALVRRAGRRVRR